MARLPYPGSRFSPMRLVPLSDPFDDPDWVWEPKFDGFRALAFVRSGVCRFESRDSNTLTRFPDLARAVATSIRGHEAVLDGEIVCLDEQGRSDFRALLTRTGQTVYCAFDMLEIDGRDLRDAPLDGRKGELSTLVPSSQSRTLLVEHMGETGRALFEAACAHDLEGVVGKWRHGRYVGALPTSSWVAVDNPAYSHRHRAATGGAHHRPVRLVLE